MASTAGEIVRLVNPLSNGHLWDINLEPVSCGAPSPINASLRGIVMVALPFRTPSDAGKEGHKDGTVPCREGSPDAP